MSRRYSTFQVSAYVVRMLFVCLCLCISLTTTTTTSSSSIPCLCLCSLLFFCVISKSVFFSLFLYTHGHNTTQHNVNLTQMETHGIWFITFFSFFHHHHQVQCWVLIRSCSISHAVISKHFSQSFPIHL